MKQWQSFAVVFVVVVVVALIPSISCDVDFTCGDGKKSCQVLIGGNLTLKIVQTISASTSVTYNFRYSIEDRTTDEPKKNGQLMFTPIPSQTLTGNKTKEIVVETSSGGDVAGELRIALNSSGLTKTPVVDVTITRSPWLKAFGAVVGWIYFIAWSISFYPQCYVNFRRKSVIGLNFDFIALNLTGFTCYAIYNLCLFYNEHVREIYFKNHPLGVIQVEPNDVFFALHAIAITLITIVQCFLYERGEQAVSRFCRALLLAMCLYSVVCLILSAANVMTWLRFAEFLSYLKLFITIIKYIPQAYMNYKRKSTDGWSIWNILLDFTGGSLSILQMFLKSYNYDDWKSIFGNVTKFGLGFFSVLFDVLFILQHYVFYRHNQPYDEIINGSRVRTV